MMTRMLYRLVVVALLVLIFASLTSAFAAANTVPSTRLTDQSRAIAANDLKPAECAALNLVSVIVCPAGGGNCNGDNQNNLILGSPNADTIRGRGGNDCILGGGGDDTLQGNAGGRDVCIGGPGNDIFQTCETTYP
jgi:Ca2+-binding RTX toxin-like protein